MVLKGSGTSSDVEEWFLHMKYCLDTSWLCYNSTKFWYYLPYRWEVPSLHLIDLLGQLTELWETFSLVHYQFITKGYQLGSQLKRCTRQGMRKVLRALMPSVRVPLAPNLHVFTNHEPPQTLSFGGFMEVLSHRCHWLNHWPLVIRTNLQSLSSPRRLGCHQKF